MSSIRSRKHRLFLLLFMFVSISWLGCGPSADPTAAPPLKEDEKAKIIAALPPGVTLESTIEPDVMLGPNSKTVGDALTSIHAYVKDDKIYNGGMSSVVQFKTAKDASKSKPAKSGKGKERDDMTTIVLSGG